MSRCHKGAVCTPVDISIGAHLRGRDGGGAFVEQDTQCGWPLVKSGR